MKPKIFIFSMFNWESELMHREHMLARYFSEHKYEVNFVERKWFSLPKKRSINGINVITVGALPYLHGRFKLIFKINDALINFQLSKYLRGEDKKWYICSTPLWAIKKSISKNSYLAYDLSDDLLAFTKNQAWAKNLRVYQTQMVKEANICFIANEDLRKTVLGCNRVILIENGVDLNGFKTAKPILEKSDRKRAGFIGGIYDWVDLDLVKKAAITFPEVDFILVGPTNQTAKLDQLNNMKNIKYFGKQPWQKIGDYFASLDLGLLPFASEKEYPRLKSVNSNKIFQYSFFGYPIVSSDFSQARELSEIVYVSKDAKDFTKKIAQALNEEGKNIVKRELFAEKNSWDNRIKEMIQAMEEAEK